MCSWTSNTFITEPASQTIAMAMGRGIQTQKAKKRRTVTIMKRGLSSIEKEEKKKKRQRSGSGASDLHEEDEEEAERALQEDPLKGKIREAMPEEYLIRAARWYVETVPLPCTALATTLPIFWLPIFWLPCCRYLLEEVSGYGVVPEKSHSTYDRAMGRVLAFSELWMFARGSDLRGVPQEGEPLSVAKLFGNYKANQIVGPDNYYELKILKDDSKANKVGRPELIGATRHRNPWLCSINAIAAMLLLRFGKDGLLEMPDFFDAYNNWPAQHQFLTASDGRDCITYDFQKALFAGMKSAAGMTHLMEDSATKLRSWGAMAASEQQVPHAEIERMGRCQPCYLSLAC